MSQSAMKHEGGDELDPSQEPSPDDPDESSVSDRHLTTITRCG
jgi:hypothetical protein